MKEKLISLVEMKKKTSQIITMPHLRNTCNLKLLHLLLLLQGVNKHYVKDNEVYSHMTKFE